MSTIKETLELLKNLGVDRQTRSIIKKKKYKMKHLSRLEKSEMKSIFENRIQRKFIEKAIKNFKSKKKSQDKKDEISKRKSSNHKSSKEGKKEKSFNLKAFSFHRKSKDEDEEKSKKVKKAKKDKNKDDADKKEKKRKREKKGHEKKKTSSKEDGNKKDKKAKKKKSHEFAMTNEESKQLVADIKKNEGLIMISKLHLGKEYMDCFLSKDLINEIMGIKKVRKSKAIKMGQKLLEHGYISGFKGETEFTTIRTFFTYKQPDETIPVRKEISSFSAKKNTELTKQKNSESRDKASKQKKEPESKETPIPAQKTNSANLGALEAEKQKIEQLMKQIETEKKKREELEKTLKEERISNQKDMQKDIRAKEAAVKAKRLAAEREIQRIKDEKEKLKELESEKRKEEEAKELAGRRMSVKKEEDVITDESETEYDSSYEEGSYYTDETDYSEYSDEKERKAPEEEKRKPVQKNVAKNVEKTAKKVERREIDKQSSSTFSRTESYYSTSEYESSEREPSKPSTPKSPVNVKHIHKEGSMVSRLIHRYESRCVNCFVEKPYSQLTEIRGDDVCSQCFGEYVENLSSSGEEEEVLENEKAKILERIKKRGGMNIATSQEFANIDISCSKCYGKFPYSVIRTEGNKRYCPGCSLKVKRSKQYRFRPKK